jgi:predicted MFS family arabinose efflux permease
LNGLIIAIVEMVLVYKLEGRRHVISYIRIGALLVGLSYLVLNIAPIFSVVVFSMLLVTAGEMLMFPFFNTVWIAKSKEHNRGQYAAVYTMAFSTAHVLAPTVGSQIIRHFGYDVLWYCLFTICSIAALGFHSFRKMKL